VSYRRNAWNKPLLRKVGAAATSSSSGSTAGFNSIYLAGSWYAPGQPAIGNSPTGGTTGALAYSTPTANILWAIPHTFGVSGTLTDLASYMNGNGGGSNSAWFALYRSNAGQTAPAARAFSIQHTVANFANTKTETNAVGLAVAAGETIWFASVTSGPLCIGTLGTNLFPILGTNFDGSGGAAPLRSMRVGYRGAFAFAQPPDPWAIATFWLSTDDSSGGNIGAAIPLFKFTPS
jgi:hypothetical protein